MSERDALERAVIVWLVETLHYPFDVSFSTPPPVDHGKLADYWNESDGWKVSAEAARNSVYEEAGIDPTTTRPTDGDEAREVGG